MKPKKVTREAEASALQKDACDTIIARAAHMMVEEIGAPMDLMLDRLLTYAGAQSAVNQGSRNTATVFRELADKVEAGIFHSITGEGDQRRN